MEEPLETPVVQAMPAIRVLTGRQAMPAMQETVV
jgi:hypothetical protein